MSGTFKIVNHKGITQIEIMIIIVIIEILSAIAITKFLYLRNMNFCSRAETDAVDIADAVADYFAIPNHMQTPHISQFNSGNSYAFSGTGSVRNTGTITGAITLVNITIIVIDRSGRSTADYQHVNDRWKTNVFKKNLKR